ncbi:hypothetical protein ABPG74_006901 [Tetrahymena malaccensis]
MGSDNQQTSQGIIRDDCDIPPAQDFHQYQPQYDTYSCISLNADQQDNPKSYQLFDKNLKNSINSSNISDQITTQLASDENIQIKKAKSIDFKSDQNNFLSYSNNSKTEDFEKYKEQALQDVDRMISHYQSSNFQLTNRSQENYSKQFFQDRFDQLIELADKLKARGQYKNLVFQVAVAYSNINFFHKYTLPYASESNKQKNVEIQQPRFCLCGKFYSSIHRASLLNHINLKHFQKNKQSIEKTNQYQTYLDYLQIYKPFDDHTGCQSSFDSNILNHKRYFITYFESDLIKSNFDTNVVSDLAFIEKLSYEIQNVSSTGENNNQLQIYFEELEKKLKRLKPKQTTDHSEKPIIKKKDIQQKPNIRRCLSKQNEDERAEYGNKQRKQIKTEQSILQESCDSILNQQNSDVQISDIKLQMPQSEKKLGQKSRKTRKQKSSQIENKSAEYGDLQQKKIKKEQYEYEDFEQEDEQRKKIKTEQMYLQESCDSMLNQQNSDVQIFDVELEMPLSQKKLRQEKPKGRKPQSFQTENKSAEYGDIQKKKIKKEQSSLDQFSYKKFNTQNHFPQLCNVKKQNNYPCPSDYDYDDEGGDEEEEKPLIKKNQSKLSKKRFKKQNLEEKLPRKKKITDLSNKRLNKKNFKTEQTFNCQNWSQIINQQNNDNNNNYQILENNEEVPPTPKSLEKIEHQYEQGQKKKQIFESAQNLIDMDNHEQYHKNCIQIDTSIIYSNMYNNQQQFTQQQIQNLDSTGLAQVNKFDQHKFSIFTNQNYEQEIIEDQIIQCDQQYLETKPNINYEIIQKDNTRFMLFNTSHQPIINRQNQSNQIINSTHANAQENLTLNNSNININSDIIQMNEFQEIEKQFFEENYYSQQMDQSNYIHSQNHQHQCLPNKCNFEHIKQANYDQLDNQQLQCFQNISTLPQQNPSNTLNYQQTQQVNDPFAIQSSLQIPVQQQQEIQNQEILREFFDQDSYLYNMDQINNYQPENLIQPFQRDTYLSFDLDQNTLNMQIQTENDTQTHKNQSNYQELYELWF